MRFKLPAVSMAFFKVPVGNPVSTVPLPTSAGSCSPSAKMVPGADTKICYQTKEKQFRSSDQISWNCVLFAVVKFEKLRKLSLRTSFHFVVVITD
jgi:hypothetical protein